jgi:hypothetical protein
MLLTPGDVEGYHDHPDASTEGELTAAIVCPQAGPVLLFDGEPQVATSLDDDAVEGIEQLLSAEVEQDQRRRFVEAAAALDTCDGTSFEAEEGMVSVTRLSDPSLPNDARLFQLLFTHESGNETPYHAAYALVGSVLTFLWFARIERHDVLTIVNRALSKIGEATGFPGPPDTVGPSEPPPVESIPAGYVEQMVPDLAPVPVTDCSAIEGSGPAPAPTAAALPSVQLAEPQWVAQADQGFYQPFAAHDGLAFLMDGTTLTALRAQDGARAWHVDAGSGAAFLAAGGDSLFVADETDGLVTVAAFDLVSGAQRWATAVRFAATYWGLLAAEDTVYLHLLPDEPTGSGRTSGETWAVDAGTGALRWRVNGPPRAAAAGVVLVGVSDGCGLTAFDAVTGAARWTVGIDTFFYGIDVVDGRVLALRDQPARGSRSEFRCRRLEHAAARSPRPNWLGG